MNRNVQSVATFATVGGVTDDVVVSNLAARYLLPHEKVRNNNIGSNSTNGSKSCHTLNITVHDIAVGSGQQGIGLHRVCGKTAADNTGSTGKAGKTSRTMTSAGVMSVAAMAVMAVVSAVADVLVDDGDDGAGGESAGSKNTPSTRWGSC